MMCITCNNMLKGVEIYYESSVCDKCDKIIHDNSPIDKERSFEVECKDNLLIEEFIWRED